jgi:hypothetical protein
VSALGPVFGVPRASGSGATIRPVSPILGQRQPTDGAQRRIAKKKGKARQLAAGQGSSMQGVMTHKYRGCIVVLSINKSVEPNKEQKVLISSFDQGFTVNTSKRVFSSIW